MSGSGGNAFLDLLRALAPAAVPAWILLLLAAMGAVAVGAGLLVTCAWFIHRLERRLAGELGEAGRHGFRPALALGGTFGALAAYPLAPHVFFVDLELGLFVTLGLLAVLSLAPAMAGAADSLAREQGSRAIANALAIALALLAALVIAGTANLIEASRQQSDWFGMGWAVFKNPFALPALAILLAAGAVESPPGSESPDTRRFILAAIAAVFFLGGFESPLTWGLRRSLGMDPGFLNHAVLPDGTSQTRVAIGGLVFQLACAGTLLVKTLLVVAAMIWLRWRTPRLRVVPWLSSARGNGAAIGLVCVFGAGIWEWARAELWTGG